jgi:hypothetical protein
MGSDPHREAALHYVTRWYADHHPDYEVVLGTHDPDAPWNKAVAVARGLREAHGEVLVVADADCIAPALENAVRAVSGGHPWAMPHRKVHRLGQVATQRVYQGDDPATFPKTRDWYAQLPYEGFAGGGVIVLPTKTYRQIPLDVAFEGWGQEDEAWAIALNHLAGSCWRPPGQPLWHLWHPPQKRLNRYAGSKQSTARLRSYKQAARAGGLRGLLAESVVMVSAKSGVGSVRKPEIVLGAEYGPSHDDSR